MPWTTTADVESFREATGQLLASRPVEHSPLLTELDHLERHPEPDSDQAFGWWTGADGVVAGAFLRAPRHPTFLTPMPEEAVDGLVAVVPAERGIGCDVTTVDAVLAAWERAGSPLGPQHRVVIHLLDSLRAPPPVGGTPRPAGDGDGPLVHGWFDALMAAHPGDPSDRAYVVDDPLAEGRITLWEVGGVPVAMAGRSRTVAGMVRVGAVYAPSGDERVETAVLAAAGAAAADVASDVVVLARTDDRDSVSRLAALGYRAVRERVMLAARPTRGRRPAGPGR